MTGTSGSVAGTSRDAEYEILCDNNGAFLRRYTTEGGAAVVTDTTLDGTTAYAPVGTVLRCGVPTPNPVIDATIQRQSAAGNVTIAVGARSVTLVVYAGAPTVSIGGGPAVAVPAGTSLSWGVERGGDAGEALQDAFVFTWVTGSDFLVTSTREM
ncbi:hypothetical protein AB0F88_16855 [Streptosporangium sp. NPDC023963]|uniref:hypothetical protein n=1 Tax=Streptosporangium sp. NPDC023963 TaxID=3155608 RepID=UPI003425F629